MTSLSSVGSDRTRRDTATARRAPVAHPRVWDGVAARPRENDRVYFTDRGIEELYHRRGEEQVTLAWLAGRLREFVDEHPEFEVPVERLATWLARLDDED